MAEQQLELPDPDEGKYDIRPLLGWIADQVSERMVTVWADSYERPGGQPYRAVAGYNTRFALEWGRSNEMLGDEDGLAPEGRETEWSRRYPDHEFRVQSLDVLYRGEVIYSITIASVDGGRCLIPYPRPVLDGEGYEVSAWEASVVRLANDLTNPSDDTLDYLNRADIRTHQRPPLAEL